MIVFSLFQYSTNFLKCD